MKTLTSIIAATALIAGAAPIAVAQEDGAPFLIRAAGNANWSVECDVQTERGSSRPDARGRGKSSSGSLVARDALGATCEANGGRRGALQITLVDDRDAFVCPFNGGDLCRTIVPAGETLEFAVELKGAAG